MNANWVPVFYGSVAEVLVLQETFEANGIPALAPDVEHLDIDVDRTAPVELTRARRQHTCDLAVLAHKTHLLVADLHDREVPRHNFARLLHQEIHARMHELGHAEVVNDHGDVA